jgi:putative membrane protein
MTLIAHELVGPDGAWRSWPFDPLVVLGLVTAAAVYAVGSGRLRRADRWSVQRAAAFWAATVALGVALLSPLDAVARTLFSAHMAQHLLLMVVAAPLLVIGRPVAAWLAALPPGPRRAAARAHATIAFVPRALRRPLVAIGLVTVATWSWHAPTLYEAAVLNEPVHAIEHGSFVVASMLAWSVVLRWGRRDVSNAFGRALFLLAYALQGALLGALLVFASTPLYSVHRGGPALWGLTTLQDQQLAGALMWIPPAPVYLAAIAAVLFGAFRAMDLRADGADVNLRAGGADVDLRGDGVDVRAARLK